MSLEATIHEKYMLRCLELASKGLGKTRSNPLVGAVIVFKNQIIGEGYHYKFGGAHAEVNAINSVKNKNQLRNSTLYVNLEPCNHHGKTPPCSHLIRDVQIPKVIIGSSDPNPLVSGRGISFLADEGIEIISGILESECRFLNRRFYTFHEKRRPYIILKWARTKDNYLDNRETGDSENLPLRISGDLSRILVHKWRAEEMAIMVGSNTVNMDDPSLTVRYWTGDNPIRITFLRKSRIRDGLKIMNDRHKTIVYTRGKNLIKNNVEYVSLHGKSAFPDETLADLYNRDILTIIVEGGKELLEIFMKRDLWDEARIITGNIFAGKGLHAPLINDCGHKIKIGDDELCIINRFS